MSKGYSGTIIKATGSVSKLVIYDNDNNTSMVFEGSELQQLKNVLADEPIPTYIIPRGSDIELNCEGPGWSQFVFNLVAILCGTAIILAAIGCITGLLK